MQVRPSRVSSPPSVSNLRSNGDSASLPTPTSNHSARRTQPSPAPAQADPPSNAFAAAAAAAVSASTAAASHAASQRHHPVPAVQVAPSKSSPDSSSSSLSSTPAAGSTDDVRLTQRVVSARNGSGSNMSTSATAASMAASQPSQRPRPGSKHGSDDDDDEDELTDDDLSIEKSGDSATAAMGNAAAATLLLTSMFCSGLSSVCSSYMRRHPCILDRSSSFLERHGWLHPLLIVLLIGAGTATGTLCLRDILSFDENWLHFVAVYAAVLVCLILFVVACTRSPGTPPVVCTSEVAVIHLLHDWPAQGHHYGLHASEWNRSWSRCRECHIWRPARTHHCRRCRQCVLMTDHHCVWINQCVGANNVRVFIAFLAWLMLLSLYSDGLAVWYQKSSVHANLLLLLVHAFLSLLGTCASVYLLSRMVLAIFRNETGIEALKKASWQRHERRLREEEASGRTSKGRPLEQLGNGSAVQAEEIQRAQTREEIMAREVRRHLQEKSHMQERASLLRSSDAPQANGRPAADAAAASSSTLSLVPPPPLTSPHSPHHTSADDAIGTEPVFFTPFQCSCHATSYRKQYCSRFNFPAIESTKTPIPPLPFYFDYDTGQSSMNWKLFFEDVKRMERLHEWSQQGAHPIRVRGRHMQLQ